MKRLKKRVKTVGRLTIRMPVDGKTCDAIMIAVFMLHAATDKAFSFSSDGKALTIDGED